MTSLLAGGFASGYRTYVLGFLIALQAVVSWAVGDASMAELIEQLPEILAGLGLMTVRAGIASTLADLVREISNTQITARNTPSHHGTTLQSHAMATMILSLFAIALVGCASAPVESAREKLLAAETVYAGLVNTAADAVESGLLSSGQIEDFEAGTSLVRLALDDVHSTLQIQDEIGAVAALSIVAARLNDLADILETRANE